MEFSIKGRASALHRKDDRFQPPQDGPKAPKGFRTTYYNTRTKRVLPRGVRVPQPHFVPVQPWYRRQAEVDARAYLHWQKLRSVILSIRPEAVERLGHDGLEGLVRHDMHVHLRKLVQVLDKTTTRTLKTQQRHAVLNGTDGSAKCQIGAFVKGPVPELLGNSGLSREHPNRIERPHGDVFCESRPQLVLHRMADRCITLVGGSRGGKGIEQSRLDECVRILRDDIRYERLPGERGPVLLHDSQLTDKTFLEAKFNVLFYKEKIKSYGGEMSSEGAKVIVHLVHNNVQRWLKAFADKHNLDLTSLMLALYNGSPRKRRQSEAGMENSSNEGSPRKRSNALKGFGSPVPRSDQFGAPPNKQHPLPVFEKPKESSSQYDGEATPLNEVGGDTLGDESFIANIGSRDQPRRDNVPTGRAPTRLSEATPGIDTQAANFMVQLDLQKESTESLKVPDAEAESRA